MNSRSRTADQHEQADAPSDSGGGRARSGSTTTRSICVVADDFGLHAGTCTAALRLAAMGRVQAIGCMVGGAAWPTWQPLLARLDGPRLDIGLHLDFTERPLTLEPERLRSLVLRSYARTLPRRAVVAEVGAQLDAFEQAMGRAPDFIDGHQHVHQLPIVRQALIDAVRTRYADRLPWLRSTRCAADGGANAAGPWWARFKPELIALLGSRALARGAKRAGIRQNGGLLGVYDFTGRESDHLQRLRQWLGACSHGDVLMVHPSLIPCASDPIDAARRVEYQLLSGAAFGGLIRDFGLALEPMSRILSRLHHTEKH